MDEAFRERFSSGLLEIEAGRLAEAIASFRAAASLQPGHPGVWYLMGLVLRTAGRAAPGVAALDRAGCLRPEDPNTLFHLAAGLLELGRPSRALPLLSFLVQQRPDYEGAAFALGNALMMLDEPEGAERAFRLAALLEPGAPSAVNNRGAAFMAQRRLESAVGQFRRAIRIEPATPEHHKNLGIAQLMRGELEEGFREYEWRSGQAIWRWNRDFPGKPVWGGGLFAGRTILIHHEQGLGDSVQFARYFPLLKAMGARTIFECQPVLMELLAPAPGVDRLVAHGEPLPEFDCYLSLMSLPYRCRTRMETIPQGIPYLRTEPARAVFWRERIAARHRPGELRVGIQWRADGADRSIPLRCFEPLARVPGLRLYSLQQATGQEELAQFGERFGIVDLPGRRPGAEGFVDTAAIVESMDLVVACDSVVGHIAGALGRPVFLAVPWIGDWRWMNHPERTPWYPAHRLFRMERPNDWSGVMARIAGAVAEMVIGGGRRVRS